jgi:hypothetical protein
MSVIAGGAVVVTGGAVSVGDGAVAVVGGAVVTGPCGVEDAGQALPENM